MKTLWYWHAYHDTLISPFSDQRAINGRISVIRYTKPTYGETPEMIKLRLRLFKPVIGTIPSSIVDYLTMGGSYNSITNRSWYALYRLHARECTNCPWWGLKTRLEAGNIFRGSNPYVTPDEAFHLPEDGKRKLKP